MTNAHKEEAQKLMSKGYRRISNKFNMLSRIDRDDWLEVLAEHLHRSVAELCEKSTGKPVASWCDYYRRVLSKDTITVPQEVAKMVSSSVWDDVGFIEVVVPVEAFFTFSTSGILQEVEKQRSKVGSAKARVKHLQKLIKQSNRKIRDCEKLIGSLSLEIERRKSDAE